MSVEFINLTKLLFAAKNREPVRVCSEPISSSLTADTKVGMTSPSGITSYASICRPLSAIKERAKISTIAILLDRILIDKDVYLANLNGGAQGYAEVVSKKNPSVRYAGIYDGTRVRWLDGNRPESVTALLAPFFAYCLAQDGYTTSDYNDILAEWTSRNAISQGLLFRICDNFYYEFAYNHKEEISNTDELLMAELSQTRRTNSYSALCENESVYFSKMKASSDTVAFNNDERWDKIKTGEYMVPYNWSAEQQKRIPSISNLDTFVPTADFYELLDIINNCANGVLSELENGKSELEAIKNHYTNSILVGKPGTGKTSIAYALGAALGVPVYTVTNSRNTEEDNYEGKNKVIDGKITFCPTLFLEAYKNGGIIVLEEFNLVSPDVLMGAIGQAIEAPFVLMEDGYKEVHRHPLCFLIATMNSCTQGSKEPNEAFTSRCPDVFLMDDPEPDDFIKILVNNGNTLSDSKDVYKMYTNIIDYLNSNSYEDIALSITMRHCLAALRAIKSGIPFKRAVKRSIVNAIGVKDIDLAKEVYESVVEISRMRKV